ncbi:MAG TPA: TrkA family potassium uptake protein [Acidimicrobiia bacterium]
MGKDTRSGGVRRPRYEILVIGLGRFGSAVAESLVELGHDVLGVDANPKLVQKYSGTLTHVVEVDSTSIEALKQLGVPEFERAVVGIGTDIESSILTTAALVDLGVPNIWAKAITEPHGKILERVGAHHVVFPEHDMGLRLAHLVTGRMMEYIEFDEGFALVETRAPSELVGKSLGEVGVRRRYGLTVVAVKPAGQAFTYATAETVVGAGDLLVVAGDAARAEAFAELT